MRVWDAISGRNAQVFKTPTAVALVLAWSSDGKHIVLGLNDHSAQIWDVASGRKLLTYRGHADRVYSVSWSPDGRRIATGSGVVARWAATRLCEL